MLSDIRTIKVQGANFKTETSLDFFKPSSVKKSGTVKGALVYGKNGSGKSTIAKAFRYAAGQDDNKFVTAYLYDESGNIVTLSEQEKDQVFIFDEDYVYKKVKLKEEHLDTIVMLGEMAELEDQIKVAEDERDAAKKALDENDKEFKLYCDSSNPKSPSYYEESMKKALKGDDNWAGRDKIIYGKNMNSKVDKEAYKKFINLNPVKPRSELYADFEDNKKKLENAKSGNTVIKTVVQQVDDDYKNYNDSDLHTLLAKKIEKPELSEREEKLLLLAQTGRVELNSRLNFFQDEKNVECPYCFQPLSAEHKNSLINEIKRVLNEEIKEHQKALESYILSKISMDLSPFEQLDNYAECVKVLNAANTAINDINLFISKKIDNPYQPVVEDIPYFSTKIDLLIDELKKLEEARLSYNEEVTKIEPIINNLNRINGEITYYDIKDFYDLFKKHEKECNQHREKNIELKRIYEEKQELVNNLYEQQSKVTLAIDVINACMNYIFFSDSRLKVVYDNDKYKLLSNGQSVRPMDISVGERNILGLSYFFTSILNNQDEKNAYKREYLLVIDDPVSSFDLENRIGIMSFLKYKLSLFLEGNKNTRALIMTHDLMTYYDAKKILEEIRNSCNKIHPRNKIFFCFALREGKLSEYDDNEAPQEYTEILKTIYSYACGKGSRYNLIIGNLMRQALEAFTTFEFKKGIIEVSTDKGILQLLKKKEYILYFENLMYRLVLNGESHKKEQIDAMKDLRFFSVISNEEKLRTAKDILCFMYLLNSKHILMHLSDQKKVKSNFDNWLSDIRSNSIGEYKT